MLTLQWKQEKAIRASFEDGVESVALNMIQLGKSFEDICEATKLSIERVEELAKSFKNKLEKKSC